MRLALVLLIGLNIVDAANAAQMAMGFKVGEVTQSSAIVWTRVTKDAERNWQGVKPPQKREPQQREYIPSPIKSLTAKVKPPEQRGKFA